MSNKTLQPPPINRVEEFAEIRINDPIDLALLDRDCNRIQRVMLTAPWAKTIRDADKVALIDRIEYRDDGVLDDFVLQRRDAERSLSTISLRDVGSSHRLCSVAAAVYRSMQRAQPAIELLQIHLPHFRELDRQVQELEREINAWHREDTASQRLQAIPGIGPLTASALVASVGDAKVFHNGRQFAAWLGLVPCQDSSGGKTNLLGISKRGDTYLRTMLIHGARSVLLSLKRHPDRAGGWLARLADRRNHNIAAVALANKNARIAWALLAHGRDYQAGFRSANPVAVGA